MVKLVSFVITFFFLINKCVIWGGAGDGTGEALSVLNNKKAATLVNLIFNI